MTAAGRITAAKLAEGTRIRVEVGSAIVAGHYIADLPVVIADGAMNCASTTKIGGTVNGTVTKVERVSVAVNGWRQRNGTRIVSTIALDDGRVAMTHDAPAQTHMLAREDRPTLAAEVVEAPAVLADAPVVEVEVGVEVETPAELPAPIAANREAWLEAAVVELRPLFQSLAGVELPERVRVSCGWPGHGRKAIGTCWYTAADKVAQVFVSPVLDEPVEVLGVLVHELIHAWDRGASKHKGAFRVAALAMGLTGKMTATTVGDELRPVLADLAEQLGTYPHARITVAEPAGTAKQTTRMIKVECPNDGYTARTTRKWLDDLGTPTCPCGERMAEPAA